MSKRTTDEANHGRAKATRRIDRSASEPADWSSVDGGILQELITRVTAHGGAVRFGYTSDGGAYAVGFYDGDDKYTEYIRPNEDVNDVIRAFIAAWS